jgi:hypothetical protein
MMQIKIYSKHLTVALIFISTGSFAQEISSPATPVKQQMTVTTSKLNDACSKTYSGSSNQVADCMTCAKNAADINSLRFINCMSSFEIINERRHGQTGVDDLIGNTPNCIKGVKSFGC